MSELGSIDVELSAYPGEADQLGVAIPQKRLRSGHIDFLQNPHEESGHILLGRSVLGQLGVDVGHAEGDLIPHNGYLHLPVNLIAHNFTGRAIESDVREIRSRTEDGKLLTWHKKPIQFGRVVNFDYLQRLDKDEMTTAAEKMLVSFGVDEENEPVADTYHINDNGSVTLPIGLVEFVFNPNRFATPEQRFNAIKHGRAGIIPNMDTIERNTDDNLPSFLVGGVVLSTGPYHWKIREDLDDAGKVRQLPSASMFDGNRLMGISNTHDEYSRHRQLEIVSKGNQHTFGETYVTLDAYRSTKTQEALNPAVKWWNMDIDSRRKLHRTGVNPLDVIMAADPTSRQLLLDTVNGPKVGAVILSAQGTAAVDRGQTDKFMAQNINDTAREFAHEYTKPRSVWLTRKLRPFVEALKPAADRSRMVVADRLLAEHMPSIVEGGDVRSFLVKDFGPVAMTKETHSALVEKVRQGVTVGWANGSLRTLHESGLWVKSEQADRMEKLDLVIAMYGGHKKVIGDALDNQIGEFFDDLSELMPVERIGVAHGNGPGVMQIADERARQHGMMSLGVGIDVEKIGQGTLNTSPDGIAFFSTDERLYRQQMLDTFNTISMFNVGGFGTLEELAISLCTHKLLICLPTPKIMVDPDNLYPDVIKFVDEISNREKLEIDGNVINIKEYPLGQKWVKNTLHRVEDYSKAFDIIKRFHDDPGAYWRAAGIPEKEIKMALENNHSQLKKVGMRPAESIRRSAENYTDQIAV